MKLISNQIRKRRPALTPRSQRAFTRFLRMEPLEQRRLLAITASWDGTTLDIQGVNERVSPFPTPETEDFKVTAEQNGGSGPFFVKIYENECLPTCGIGNGDYDDPMFLITIQNAPVGGLNAATVADMLIETWGADDFIDLREVTSSRGFSFVPTWINTSSDAPTVYGGDGKDIIHGSEFGDCIKGGRADSEDPPAAPNFDNSDGSCRTIHSFQA